MKQVRVLLLQIIFILKQLVNQEMDLAKVLLDDVSIQNLRNQDIFEVGLRKAGWKASLIDLFGVFIGCVIRQVLVSEFLIHAF